MPTADCWSEKHLLKICSGCGAASDLKLTSVSPQEAGTGKHSWTTQIVRIRRNNDFQATTSLQYLADSEQLQVMYVKPAQRKAENIATTAFR